jgi:hypothetical protein
MVSDEDGPHDPRTGKFRPGQSGNLKGRPRKPKSLGAAITSAFNEKVPVTEGGRRKRITKLEAAAKQIANKSASGDAKVAKLGLDLIQKTEDRQGSTVPQTSKLSETDTQIADRLVTRIRAIVATENMDKEQSNDH